MGDGASSLVMLYAKLMLRARLGGYSNTTLGIFLSVPYYLESHNVVSNFC